MHRKNMRNLIERSISYSRKKEKEQEMCMQSFSNTIRLAFSSRKVVISIYYQSTNCSKTDSIKR